MTAGFLCLVLGESKRVELFPNISNPAVLGVVMLTCSGLCPDHALPLCRKLHQQLITP